MLRSNAKLFQISVASLAWFLGGCTMLKPKPAEPAKITGPTLKEVSIATAKGDTVTSVNPGLKSADSALNHSSEASQLYLQTLDNYLKLAPSDEKAPEILIWKGNHLYNEGDFTKALEIYEDMRKRFPENPLYGEASQMVAQSYAQLGRLDEAEKTYRTMLKDSDAGAQAEAKERLAQSVYLQAEKNEKEGKLQAASEGYARVAKEFPTSEIAAVALFNSGVMQEKQKKWKDAIAIYGQFFDAFFESSMLAKVLFREAKCRELDGQWESAGEKYLNLVRAYPESPDAEPSLYNAGFAFFNGKKADSAAKAFELYAKKYPQNAEAPNLLFRAVELYGEQQNWEKVGELQNLFTRRYAADKSRLIQALCMGGSAAYQRGRRDEASQLMKQVISEFAALKTTDATARFYAAQAQHTLGDLAFKKMSEFQIRANSYDNDIKQKTNFLKIAVDEYLKVLEFRIVDWTLRAAFSLGQSFEDFGIQVYRAPRKFMKSTSEQLDFEEDAMSSLTGAYARAQQQYLQVLAIGRKQEVNNKWVDDAEIRMVAMAANYVESQVKAMAIVPQILKLDASTPEKAIAGKLQQIGRITPYHEQGMKYFMAFLDIAQDYELDHKAVDSLGSKVLQSTHEMGKHYLAAAELARSAPFPAGFQPMERFFYQVKLLQEGIPKLEGKSMEYFLSGSEFATKYNLTKDPIKDSLKLSLGRAMFIQSKCLDLLSQEALINPPIPPEAGPEQRKAYSEKLETVGYQLQDQALERYHELIEKVNTGLVSSDWGELAFARLFQIEPDKWSRATEADTSIDIYTSREWISLSEFPKAGWPEAENPIWQKVRKGVIPRKNYPKEVQEPFRFLWAGDKGQGPKVDTTTANYIPWKQIWTQTTFTLPGQVTGMELWVVAPQEWSAQIDNIEVLSFKNAQGPWEKGVSKEVWPQLAKKLQGGNHFLRIYAQNPKPTEGFGVWARLRIRFKLEASGAVFPWNQTATTPEYLKNLREQPIFIQNFTDRNVKK
jgi:TolA-binding protein